MSSSSKGEETSLHLHRSIVTVYVSSKKYPFQFHKGRLCQHSSFFETRYPGSCQDATTGSLDLEEYGVDEFKLFEEWLYSEKLNYPKDSNNPSLLLVKVFCLAKDFGISNLQNATLDAIRDLATEQHSSLTTQNTIYEQYARPQSIFGSLPQPVFGLPKYQTTTSPGLEEPVDKYLPPATASAIYYAYLKTPESSPLRRLLTDIFAYNVKPEAFYKDIHSFPAQFMADVPYVTKKRLPFRLHAEEADFDNNADKYYVDDSFSTPNDRKQRASEDVEVRRIGCDFDSRDGLAAEAAVLEP